MANALQEQSTPLHGSDELLFAPTVRSSHAASREESYLFVIEGDMSMVTLDQYLKDHTIDPLRLSAVADVRFLVVWNATHEKPISQVSAQKIRTALHKLTGEVYTGTLLTKQEEQQPVKRVLTRQ